MGRPQYAHRKQLRFAALAFLTLIIAVITATWLAAACGGKAPDRGIQHNSPGIGRLEAVPTGTSFSDAWAELDALACPEGVDGKLWEELKAALKEALGKTAATPPTGDINRVADLAMEDHNDGSYTFTWHYRNLGDYDQDGKVSISDITPIAQHFGETYDTETEPNSIQAVIDGSGNGKVDIADITAIAQNFGTECAAYSVRSAASYPASIDDTTVLDTVPVEPEQWEERGAFSVDFALPPYTYIAVAPADNDGTLGELSNVRYTPNHLPAAAIAADPAQGDAPLTVSFDASESHDPDGPIAKYEWDWEGDGVWDEDTGAVSTAQHKYNQARIYDPAVRVTDSSGAQDVASTTVTAGTWHIYEATDHKGYYTSLAVVNGHPAIAYIGLETGEYRLMYVRAGDSLGTNWGTPVAVSEDDYGLDSSLVSLVVVSGNPAIASGIYDNDSVKYVRAEDTSGDAWGGSQVIGSARFRMGPPDCNIGLTLEVVNGNPAVAYVDHDTKAIAFNRALDPDGAAWGSPVVVEPVDSSYCYPVMALVNGRPAICYQEDFGSFYYARALDDDGASWGGPSVFDCDDFMYSCSLAEVPAHPAIAYFGHEDVAMLVLAFRRASDANGSMWNEPVVLCRGVADSCVLPGRAPSLAVIDGRPAVAYVNHYSALDRGVLFVEARDATGDEWREPVAVHFYSGEYDYCSLAEVESHPAISFGANHVGFAIYY
jgi:PKD repeat protein